MARRSKRHDTVSKSELDRLLPALLKAHQELCAIQAVLTIGGRHYRLCSALHDHLHYVARDLSGDERALLPRPHSAGR